MPTLRINKELEQTPHFVTLTVIEWIDIFTKPEYFQIIIDSLSYCRMHKGLLLYDYVIMTNHIHLIIQATSPNSLSQIISDFKKHTTQKIWELLQKDNRTYIKTLLEHSYSKKHGYTKQIWQRENYPEPLTSYEFLKTKVNYIHQNPVRKGYVEKPEDWKYGSAKNWILGIDTVIALDSYQF